MIYLLLPKIIDKVHTSLLEEPYFQNLFLLDSSLASLKRQNMRKNIYGPFLVYQCPLFRFITSIFQMYQHLYFVLRSNQTHAQKDRQQLAQLIIYLYRNYLRSRHTFFYIPNDPNVENMTFLYCLQFPGNWKCLLFILQYLQIII